MITAFRTLALLTLITGVAYPLAVTAIAHVALPKPKLLAPAAVGPSYFQARTNSGSGLDPHLSPAEARAQVAAVATARNVAAERVRALVEAHVEAPFLGEPVVHVGDLNAALDRQFGQR